MPRAASKPGLAFVGWTRATTWENVVFQRLPPIEDFLAIRMQPDFKARSAFEAEADKLFDEFLLRHGVTESAHIAAHQNHLQRVIQARDKRAATQEELDDLEAKRNNKKRDRKAGLSIREKNMTRSQLSKKKGLLQRNRVF